MEHHTFANVVLLLTEAACLELWREGSNEGHHTVSTGRDKIISDASVTAMQDVRVVQTQVIACGGSGPFVC